MTSSRPSTPPSQTWTKIREFAEKAEAADVALFFYAGHGMQVNGVNYLIPIDAKLDTLTALDFETVNAENSHPLYVIGYARRSGVS